MFKELPVLQNNESTICAKCPTPCCTHMPGAVFPEQLPELTVEAVKHLLDNGYAIDWWEGDPTGGILSDVYYLRPKIKGYEHKIYHPAWGGECTFYSEVGGCKHEFKDRPLECQNLKPGFPSPGNCKPEKQLTKKEAAIAWIPYQHLLTNIT